MAWLRKIKAGLVKIDVDQFIGEEGNLFFDIETGSLRLSDGSTPGGVLLGSGSGYILPTASTTTKGGVKVDGTTITISNQVISGFSGDYNDLDNKPVITTNLSDLDDISVLNPLDYQVLMFNQSSQKFENIDINLSGGSTNQVLVKKSSNNFDYEWEDMIIDPAYTKLIDDSVAGYMYVGEAAPSSAESSAVWRIQQIVFDVNGNVDAIRYANNGNFNCVWNNRLSLSYT